MAASVDRDRCRFGVLGKLAAFFQKASSWVAADVHHRARRPQAHKNMRARQEIGKRAGCSATPIVGRLRGERCGQPSERDFLCSRSVVAELCISSQPGRFFSTFKGGRCTGWGGRDRTSEWRIKICLII